MSGRRLSSWSGIRRKLEQDYLCPALRGRIQYFAATYRQSHDREGRVAIRQDGAEMLRSDYYAHLRALWPQYDRLMAGREKARREEIARELKRYKNLKHTPIPRDLAYLSGEGFRQYIRDMKLVQQFAMLNRQAMMDEILKGMKLHAEERFTTIHNYIDTDAMILRKGAVSARAGEKLLNPHQHAGREPDLPGPGQ